MPVPAFNIPQTLGLSPNWIPVWFTHGRLKKWLSKNNDHVDYRFISECLTRLRKLNTVNYSSKTRLQLLETLQLSLSDLFSREKEIIQHAINTDDPEQNSLQLLDSLFNEYANGYKLIIQQLAEQKQLDETGAQHIQEAIYYCLKFLAQRLLLSYTQYSSPPRGVWREINQIYQYAEDNSLLYHIIDDPVSDSSLPVFHSAEFIYKRIVLLALAEPFRLMRGECLELYDLCCRWVSVCSLLPVNQLSAQGEYSVDLADDLPPRFITPELGWTLLSGRLIDMRETISRLENDISQQQESYATETNGLELQNLDSKQKHYLLTRTLDSYRAKPIRQTRRFALSDKIIFVNGINNCHYYLSNKKQLSPYMDELKFCSNRSHSDNSQIDGFSNQYKLALEQDRSYKWQGQSSNHARQQNINPLGLAFSYRMPRQQGQQTVSVGEVIAYRSTKKSSQRWVIGTISWMKRKSVAQNSHSYDIGVQNIARNAIATVARKDKDEDDSPYYRTLLIPRHVSHQQLRSLIVPALSFELHDSLLLNLERTLMKIRLTRLISSSTVFNQFEFEVL